MNAAADDDHSLPFSLAGLGSAGVDQIPKTVGRPSKLQTA
jgi:hypothetical protein